MALPSSENGNPGRSGRAAPAGKARRSWLAAVLRQRCPRCREGRVFRGRFAMNDPCPVCGLRFEREPGYFLGAMYFSYGLAVVILVPMFFLARWLFPALPEPLVPVVAVLPYFPLMPAIFRYSRVLWIYFDRSVSPSEASTHAGWLRWKESQEEGRRT